MGMVPLPLPLRRVSRSVSLPLKKKTSVPLTTISRRLALVHLRRYPLEMTMALSGPLHQPEGLHSFLDLVLLHLLLRVAILVLEPLRPHFPHLLHSDYPLHTTLFLRYLRLTVD